jgi:uncharacterized protein (DUF1684 family)
LILAAVLLVATAACSPTPIEDYVTRVASGREQKDRMFRESDESPVKKENLSRFVPLAYFPIDESYAVPAQLDVFKQRETFTMPTSTGTLRNVERLGKLRFNLKGEPLELTAFLEEGSQTLFVPFSDLTSGTETYQAGRYMNLEPMGSGIYIVDFNSAYHPYCYYNADYECPLPPAENRLNIPIRAGERLNNADTMVVR